MSVAYDGDIHAEKVHGQYNEAAAALRDVDRILSTLIKFPS